MTIDTEEDNWGAFAESEATIRNIPHLVELHERMARWGARPTYLVNRPPLLSKQGVEVLGALADRPEVEIGGHCHPWNTPPDTGAGEAQSMMCNLPVEANRAKINEVTRLIETELGTRPRSFRAGRWGLGPTVSKPLHEAGYVVDASVSPFIDWTSEHGPDYSTAPHRPYRFDPDHPLVPSDRGAMVEIPTTVGFLGGAHRARAAVRGALEESPLRRLKVVGVLDRLGLVSRRWLSPEQSSGRDMVRLAEACIASGEPVLDLTFHSCTLLPGATPFVHDDSDRAAFMEAIDVLLRFCSEAGLRFRTLSEVGETMLNGAPERPTPG